MDLSSDMPELMIDRRMMEQVLMNLVLNAIQAMRSGGVLTISTIVEEAHCLVRVRDSGCGISFRPLDLRPFFTTKNGEGRGSGRFGRLGIVERHGDGSWLRVKSGRDHVYRVHSISTEQCHWEVFVKGLRVLIVDDEPLMRLSMLDALEGVGCEVMAAATGTEGDGTSARVKFDVVITAYVFRCRRAGLLSRSAGGVRLQK